MLVEVEVTNEILGGNYPIIKWLSGVLHLFHGLLMRSCKWNSLEVSTRGAVSSQLFCLIKFPANLVKEIGVWNVWSKEVLPASNILCTYTQMIFLELGLDCSSSNVWLAILSPQNPNAMKDKRNGVRKTKDMFLTGT